MKRLLRKKWAIFFSISTIGFLIDWYSKHLIVKNLNFLESISIIGDILKFQYIRNRAMIFGLNPKNIFPSFPLRSLQIITHIVVFFVLIYLYKNIEKYMELKNTASYIGISFLVAGLLGNLYDRIFYLGEVIDFIRFDLGFFPFNPWPLFNVADICLNVGLILLLIGPFFFKSSFQSEDTNNVIQ